MSHREDAIGGLRLAFLLGNPVSHSLSPLIHNAAFKALGIAAEYQAVDVRRTELPEAIERLRVGRVLGANVTIPHKETAVELVDDLTSDAAATHAVNTILVSEPGRLIGANTDVEGFSQPLKAYVDALRGGSAVILGAGGAARAAAFALLGGMGPRRLTVVARRRDQAAKLIEDLGSEDINNVLDRASFDDAAPAVRASQLIVNATPVGMAPKEDTSPWPTISDFHEGQVVYDLIYAPTTTRLMRDAESCGAHTIGGMPMLLAQAAASFKLWTGREMPLGAVRKALLGTF